jgi:hypothetical protein
MSRVPTREQQRAACKRVLHAAIDYGRASTEPAAPPPVLAVFRSLTDLLADAMERRRLNSLALEPALTAAVKALEDAEKHPEGKFLAAAREYHAIVEARRAEELEEDVQF